MLNIRPATEADHAAIWEIFRGVIAAGETYPLDKNLSREEGMAYWFQRRAHVYVAEQTAQSIGKGGSFPATLAASPPAELQRRYILGSYSLHANQAGGGAHVANAAFIVQADARGRGIGRAMGEHCLSEARRLGFRALQFNFVVSANQSAVRLWQQLGMQIVGTLPGAFRHPTKAYIDVYVMYRLL